MAPLASESAPAAPTPTWHDRPADDAFSSLHAARAGLSQEEATHRLEVHGYNRLPEPPGRSALVRFLVQFHNILIYVLLGAGAITTLLEHYIDAAVIFAVVLANAVIGYIQEGKAEKAMDSIRSMLAPSASVLRDGERRTVPACDLVPGDVVLLESGDKVPADLRLFASRGLQVREAVLTGESMPVDKATAPVAVDTPLGDRACLAFSGTIVSAGQGRGVVVATGATTEIGRIGGLLSTVETLTTPLVRQMAVFARWLTLVILVIAALVLVFGSLFSTMTFDDLFLAVVGLSVAAIPEGLPAVLTITLAVGVQAMARRNAIVRRLPAIETLGSVSVICTDKTGTLTRNEMTVASIALDADTLEVSGAGYEPVGEILRDGRPIVADDDAPVLAEFVRAAALCNDAELRRTDDGWRVEGNPMEGALLVLAEKARHDARTIRDAWTRTDAIPFDARHRYMAVLCHDHENHALIAVKGAPERLLEMCSAQRAGRDGAEPIDRRAWHERAAEIASRGQRVIAIAVRSVAPEHTVLEASDAEHSLTLLGLVGLIDPPRPEAIEAIGECATAGIRVKMITGDHAGTAAAIGAQIGLENPHSVLTGVEIDAMSDSELASRVRETDVFARTSPEHKLRLVMALQSHGMTVAMTGDGVNDAPALKRADAGIAMGLTGSEAAKEAAEFVLADDNFVSIAAAVREGRTVYDNIKKVISWTLPTNGAEGLCILIALLFGMTLPVAPVQILWINMITAVTLGVALAFEPTEDNTMRRPPRPRREPLLSPELAWQIVFVAALFVCGMFGMFFYASEYRGYSDQLAQTIAMNTLVVLEIFYLFFIRNIYGTSLTWRKARGTRVVWITVGIVTGAQFLITYAPFMQYVFRTEPVAFTDGLLLIGVCAVVFGVVELEKQLRLRFKAARADDQPQ